VSNDRNDIKFESNDRCDKAALLKHYNKDHINIIKTKPKLFDCFQVNIR